MHVVVLVMWLGLCAWQDLHQRRVSNWLTFGGLGCALAYLLLTGTSWLGNPPIEVAIALVLALLLSVPGYYLGRLGGADVKVLAVLALACTAEQLLITIATAGLLFALWAALCKSIWGHLPTAVKAHLTLLEPEKMKYWPFVPYLFAGFLTALILTDII